MHILHLKLFFFIALAEAELSSSAENKSAVASATLEPGKYLLVEVADDDLAKMIKKLPKKHKHGSSISSESSSSESEESMETSGIDSILNPLGGPEGNFTISANLTI